MQRFFGLLLGFLCLSGSVFANISPIVPTLTTALPEMLVPDQMEMTVYTLKNNLPFVVPVITLTPSATGGTYKLASNGCAGGCNRGQAALGREALPPEINWEEQKPSCNYSMQVT